MLNEINSIEKSVKTGTSYRCANKSHRNCSVTRSLDFERKLSKRSTRRKIRRLANATAKGSYSEE